MTIQTIVRIIEFACCQTYNTRGSYSYSHLPIGNDFDMTLSAHPLNPILNGVTQKSNKITT